MKEHGFYLVKREYIDLIAAIGGCYQDSKERPIYCCIKDSCIAGLYWAIPTSDVAHRTPAQLQKIENYCKLPKKDIRSAYYYLGTTNRPAIFKISSALPVTDRYVDTEYMSQGKPLCLEDKKQLLEIEKKLLRILSYENRFPNRLEQHITSIKQELLQQLHIEMLAQKAQTQPEKQSVMDKLEAAKAKCAEQNQLTSELTSPTHKPPKR